MDRRSLVAAVVAAALLGALGGVAAPPVVAGSRIVPCPERQPLTVRDLVRLQFSRSDPDLPAGERAHQCFGGHTIWIRGFVNRPEGLGGTSRTGVNPIEFEWPQLYLFEGTRESHGYGIGRFYGITVPPSLGKVWKTYRGSWVDARASYEHPYAKQCRGYGPKRDRPTRAEAIRICRDTLVLVSISTASGPPDTGTAAPAARAATPAAPAGSLPAAVLVVPLVLGAWLGWRRHPSRATPRARP